MIPGRTAFQTESARNDHIEVLLYAGPIHYDFLLPLTEQARSTFSELRTHGVQVDLPQAEWMIIGWGAEKFYTTTGNYTDVRLSTIWRSFTGDRAVLRVDLAGSPRTDLELQSLWLSDVQYGRLLAAISDSFSRDASHQIIPVNGARLGETDRFFAAQGRFDVFRTCNTWISQMIRASGLQFGIWTPTPYAVTLSMNWFHTQAK